MFIQDTGKNTYLSCCWAHRFLHAGHHSPLGSWNHAGFHRDIGFQTAVRSTFNLDIHPFDLPMQIVHVHGYNGGLQVMVLASFIMVYTTV